MNKYYNLKTQETITIDQLRTLFPNWLLIQTVDKPDTEPTQIAEKSGIEVISGRVFEKWTVRDKNEQEINATQTVIQQSLRTYRDKVLERSVSVPLADPERTIILKNNTRTKQALADKMLTLQESDASLAFEAENGWFDLSFSDYKNLRLALDSYTQKVFDSKRATDDEAPFHTFEELKDAFDTQMQQFMV